VTNFGLAKKLDGDSELTLSGRVLGSPSYMSPEQASGKRGQMGRYSDVYSQRAVPFEFDYGTSPPSGKFWHYLPLSNSLH
jgi:serine/threonine protein kinase